MSGPSETPIALEGKAISENWHIGKKLGSGSFGLVYTADHSYKRGKFVVKVVPRIGRVTGARQDLLREEIVYQRLHANGYASGFPRIFGVMKHPDLMALVLQRLGEDLESLREHCGGSFSAGTVLCIGIQCIRLLQKLHEAGFVHRDLKPRNILTGGSCGEAACRIHIADMGLVEKYAHNGEHIEKELDGFAGTPTFASVNAHKGLSQSRRDDLISLGYMLVYLQRGELPWGSINCLRKVLQMKENIEVSDLCKECPHALREYIASVQQIRFAEEPNYSGLCNTLKGGLRRLGLPEQHPMDWIQMGSKSSLLLLQKVRERK